MEAKFLEQFDSLEHTSQRILSLGAASVTSKHVLQIKNCRHLSKNYDLLSTLSTIYPNTDYADLLAGSENYRYITAFQAIDF